MIGEKFSTKREKPWLNLSKIKFEEAQVKRGEKKRERKRRKIVKKMIKGSVIESYTRVAVCPRKMLLLVY